MDVFRWGKGGALGGRDEGAKLALMGMYELCDVNEQVTLCVIISLRVTLMTRTSRRSG